MSASTLTINQTSGNENKRLKQAVMLALLLVLMAFIISSAHAGAGGTEFEDVWLTVKDWTQGTLGRVVAGAMILVGIIGGIARQSLMGFALGIGGGVGLYNSPTIVESIMSATLSNAAAITAAAQHIGNGLGM